MTTAWKAGSSRILPMMSALVVHALDDALDEAVCEDEPEGLEGGGAGLGDEARIAEPGRLQLVEEELVGGAERQAEPLVEDPDDRREVLPHLLRLGAAPGVDRLQLAGAFVGGDHLGLARL